MFEHCNRQKHAIDTMLKAKERSVYAAVTPLRLLSDVC